MDGELYSREIQNILRICDLSNGKCKLHLHIYDTVEKVCDTNISWINHGSAKAPELQQYLKMPII